MTFTNFVIMRRCLNCWHVNDSLSKRCSQCEFIFNREASEAERLLANDRVYELKRKNTEELG